MAHRITVHQPLLALAVLLSWAAPTSAQPPDAVLITEGHGGFTGTIQSGSSFGASVAAIGDLDGNGVADVAVGAPLDSEAGFRQGAVHILFLNTDGTILRHSEIPYDDSFFHKQAG